MADIGFVERWDAALSQIDAHRRGCTCDPCCTARSYLNRVRALLTEVFDD